jgi:ATP-dependent Lhr-like helicase
MRKQPDYAVFADALAAKGRLLSVKLDGSDVVWCATERREFVEAAFTEAEFSESWRLVPPQLQPERLDALRAIVAGHLDVAIPLMLEELSARACISDLVALEGVLSQLEAMGQMLRVQHNKYAAKRIVARIHSRQRDRSRSSVKAVSPATFLRFLFEYQHLGKARLGGLDGLLTVLDQLQGLEAPAGAWEESILPSRISAYSASLLDQLAQNGELGWARLSLRAESDEERRPGSTPSRSTPISLFRRSDAKWLLAAARGEARAVVPTLGAAAEVCAELASGGALFFADLADRTHRMPTEIAEALWTGVARGVITADGFSALRVLLAGRYRASSNRPSRTSRAGRPLLRRVAPASTPGMQRLAPTLAGGRWSLVNEPQSDAFERDELAESIASQMLERWGVLCWEIAQRERLGLPWREVLWALRRLEARGLVLGGRFIAGPVGEQFALPSVRDWLSRVADREPDGTEVRVSAADPINLTGILLPGPRIPAVRGRHIVFIDGVPQRAPVVAPASAAS